MSRSTCGPPQMFSLCHWCPLLLTAPYWGSLSNVRGGKRGWLQLNLVQKLQRIEHFREGATQNIRIRGSDSPPSHGMMSDRELPLPHTRALLSPGGLLLLGSHDMSLPRWTLTREKASISQPIHVHRQLSLSFQEKVMAVTEILFCLKKECSLKKFSVHPREVLFSSHNWLANVTLHQGCDFYIVFYQSGKMWVQKLFSP